ncbi:MAG: cupin protein, partial [Betaproteobacteria bacterium]|nr:cupin protein [Betaproteobacteria bacterium]
EASRLGVVFDGRGREVQDGEVERRITRFETLVPYKRQLNSNTGIPPAATEWLTAGSVYPLSVPEGHVGRSQYAPVRGLPGLTLAIAECEPGDGPLPHAHFDTQESFFVLDGQWDVTSGFRDELALAVKPYDLVAMPDKVMRAFKNTGTEKARLFVIIQGRQKMSDLIAYTPEAGAEIERRHGAATVEAFGRINITFDAGLV